MQNSQTSATLKPCDKLAWERLHKDQSWMKEFLFILVNKKPFCLVCRKTINTIKKIEIKRHYSSLHFSFEKYKGQDRLDLIKSLKQYLPTKPDSQGKQPLYGRNPCHQQVNGKDEKSCAIRLDLNSKVADFRNGSDIYFFANSGAKHICLLCSYSLDIEDESSFELHHNSQHHDFSLFDANTKAQVMSYLCQNLEDRYFLSENHLDLAKFMQANISLIKVINHEKVKHPFEYNPEYLVSTIGSIFCPEKKEIFEKFAKICSNPISESPILGETQTPIFEEPPAIIKNETIINDHPLREVNRRSVGIPSEIIRDEILPIEDYFMAVSFLSAMRSKDPTTQVGACVVNDENEVISIGYNGMPFGCHDDKLPWGKEAQNKLDTKKLYVCHAELNAILNRNGSDVSNSRIFVSLFPCNECAKLIIQSKIKEVIFYSDKRKHKEDTIAAKRLLAMADIPCRKAKLKSNNVTLDFCVAVNKETRSHLVLQEFEESLSELKIEKEVDSAPSSYANQKRQDFIAWEDYFMALAMLSAKRSINPSSQDGACIVDHNNRIVGLGYNKRLKGSLTSDAILLQDKCHNSSNHEVIHAGMNAILNKNSTNLVDCQIFVVQFPCTQCAKCIIQSGIKTVIYFVDEFNSTPDVLTAKKMFDLAKVTYRNFEGNRRTISINFDEDN